MTYINNTIMLIEEEVTGSLSNSKIQDKQIWNSLRTHILSRREKNKQAEVDAEVLRKKKCVEYQKIQENKLSLAQINGRLSLLRDKRNELEEEKRVLLNQAQSTEDSSQATSLVVPTTESNCDLLDKAANSVNNTSVPNHRLGSLHPQQPQHIFRPQSTGNAQSGLGSPAAASKLSPLSKRSLMIHNTSTNSSVHGHPTLLVCTPPNLNMAANNQSNNVTCQSSLTAPLSSSMTYTKFSPSLYNNSTHLLPPLEHSHKEAVVEKMLQNAGSNSSVHGHPTLLVCTPPVINIAANNQSNNVTCQSSLSAPLSSPMTFAKFSPSYNNNTTHLLTPNAGSSNKMGRTPSPQSQAYQQQSNVPFPTSISKYQSINSGNSVNNINSTVTTPIANSVNHPMTTATNSSFSIENSSRRGGREDSSQQFNKNVWINNNCNNSTKNPLPNVSNYGPFFQPSSTAVNYCVNNGMSSSSPSLSSVNTVYSYSGPTPHPRTEPSGNLMVNAIGEHGALQIPKPVSSHHHFNPGHSHPPLYMTPGIRNPANNHAYHPKPLGGYLDDKLVSTTPNFYPTQGIRNVHSSNTTTVPSQSHPMGQKSHNIGFPMRHPSAQSPVPQMSLPAVQTSHTSSYNAPQCSVTGSSNKSSVSVSMADAPRYQQPSSQTPMSRP